MTTIDRRTLLLGAAGSVVLAGCSDGDADADGPVIVKAEKGNIVTPEDTVALREKLGQGVRLTGDVDDS